MLSLSQLLSDALSKNTRIADRATMPNSWRGTREQRFWGNPFAAKATPSPYKLPYLPRPAHFRTCSHLSTEIWDLVRHTSPNCSRQEVNIYLNYSIRSHVKSLQIKTMEVKPQLLQA